MKKRTLSIMLMMALILNAVPFSAFADLNEGSQGVEIEMDAEEQAADETSDQDSESRIDENGAEETEAETEAQTEAETEEVTEAETETETEAQTEAETVASAEESSEAETEAETEAQAPEETSAEEVTEAETEAETEAQTEAPAVETTAAVPETTAVVTIPETTAAPAAAAVPAPEVKYPFSKSKAVGNIVITLTAEEGVFPAGSRLSVKLAKAQEKKDAEAAVSELREEGKKVAVSYTFDIKVLDKDGEEIQPADAALVKVSFKLKEAENQNLEGRIYHHSETEGVQALDTAAEGEEVSAETGSFSLYTVEFTYDALEYTLEGDSSIALSEVLEALGLSGEVTAASVSDDTLFSVTNDSGEWTIHSHQAFSTQERLKLTIDGVEYEIVVTDAPVNGPVRIGDTEYASLAEAVAAAAEGDTIVVTADQQLDEKIVISKKLTIAGENGAILSRDTNIYKGIILYVNQAELVLENIVLDGGAKWSDETVSANAVKDRTDSEPLAKDHLLYCNGGAFTMKSGTVIRNCHAGVFGNYGGPALGTRFTNVTMEEGSAVQNCTAEGDDANCSGGIGGWGGVWNLYGVIEGCGIFCRNGGGWAAALMVRSDSAAGSVNMLGNAVIRECYSDYLSTVTMRGALFNMKDQSSIRNNVSYRGAVTIYTSAVMHMYDESTVRNNTAPNGENSYAGGIFVSGNTNFDSPSSLYMHDDACISGNAGKYGGGILSAYGAVYMEDRASVTGNTAYSLGGGIYVNAGPNDKHYLNLLGGSISGNTTESGNAADGSAFYSITGAVYLNAKDFDIEGSMMMAARGTDLGTIKLVGSPEGKRFLICTPEDDTFAGRDVVMPGSCTHNGVSYSLEDVSGYAAMFEHASMIIDKGAYYYAKLGDTSHDKYLVLIRPEIKIQKAVSGSNEDRSFSFILQLEDESINGSLGSLEFVNGQAAFSLKDGESAFTYGLPANAGFTVTEEFSEANWSTAVNDREGSSYSAATSSEEIIHVFFHNHYEEPPAPTEPTEPTEPETTVPEETTPEETSPEETTPEETTPEETTPVETTPEETSPEETTPEETTPRETTPAETTGGGGGGGGGNPGGGGGGRKGYVPETEPEREQVEIPAETIPAPVIVPAAVVPAPTQAAPTAAAAQPESVRESSAAASEAAAPAPTQAPETSAALAETAEIIAESIVPQAGLRSGPSTDDRTWSLLNLIMALITLGTGIGLAGSYIKNNDRKSKLLGLIPAAAAAIIFVSSQHMGGRMVLADSWTIPMTCLMALNIALGVLSRKKEA